MKTIKLNSVIRNIILSFLITMMIFSFTSCAKKVNFLTSQVVPAARGDVKVKKDNNKNYVIRVHLSNLAEVNRLSPPKQTYVVWLVTDIGLAKNIGQINSSTGFLSKQLTAFFETVSSFKPSKIFITAEDDPSIQYPGTQIILSTDSF
jgi:hypothetical protein